MDQELDSAIFKIDTPRDLSYTVSKIQKLKKKYLKKKNNQQSSEDATSKRQSKNSDQNPQQDKIQPSESTQFKLCFQKLQLEQPDVDWDFNSNIAMSKKIGDHSIIAKKSGIAMSSAYGSKIKGINSSSPNLSGIYGKQNLSSKLTVPKSPSKTKLTKQLTKNEVEANTKQTIDYLEHAFDEINLDARQSEILRSKISKVDSSLSNINKSKIVGGNSSFISKIGYQQPMSDIRQQTIEEENYFEEECFDQDQPRKLNRKKQMSQMEQNKRLTNMLNQYTSNKINSDKNIRSSKQRQSKKSLEKTVFAKKASHDSKNSQTTKIGGSFSNQNQQNKSSNPTKETYKNAIKYQLDDDSCILTEDQISMGQSLQLSKISKFIKPQPKQDPQKSKQNAKEKTKVSNNQDSVPKIIFGQEKDSQRQQTKEWKRYGANQTDRTNYNFNTSETTQTTVKKYSPEANKNHLNVKRNQSESKMIFQASNMPKKEIKVKQIRDIDASHSNFRKNGEYELIKTSNGKFISLQQNQPCTLVSSQRLSLFRSLKFEDYINLKPYNLVLQLASIPSEKCGGTAKKLENIMAKNTVIIQVKAVQQNKLQGSPKIYNVKLITLPNQNSPYSGTILAIQRQFSDFTALRKLFKKFYPSLIIPCLQAANIFSDFPFSAQENARQKQIDQARRIQLFINEILKIESLKASTILATFLTLKQRKQLLDFFEEANGFTAPQGIQNIDLKIVRQKDCSFILEDIIKVQLSDHDLLHDEKIKGLRKNVEKWLQNQSKLESQMLKVKEQELSIYKKLKDNTKGLLSTLKMYNQSVRIEDKIDFDDGIAASISSIITKTSKNSKITKKVEYEKIQQIIFDNIMQPYSKQMCVLSQLVNEMKDLRLPFLKYQAENIKEHKDLKEIENSCIKKMMEMNQSGRKHLSTQNEYRKRRAMTERQSKHQSIYEREEFQIFKVKAKDPSQNPTVLKYQTAYFMKQFRQENKRMITQILSTTVNILNLSSV